jgi:hypothetical protein
MLRMPYSLDQAQSLCEKLQHLVGRSFDLHSSQYGKIECVAVSPFDNNSKKTFLLNYLLCDNAEKALKEDYKGLLFDVVVIARAADDPMELIQEDVASWIKKNNFIVADAPIPSEMSNNFL